MRPLVYVSAAALALAIGAAAHAQNMQESARTGPVHGVTGAEYVQKSAMTDEFEIEAGKLALQKAQDPGVRSFAQQMIQDHTQAAKKLKEAAVQAKVNTAPPKGLDAEHKAKLEDLRKKSGAAFDQAYMQMQLLGHREALNLQKAYTQSGDNPKLKDAAKDAEPMVQHHLAEAEKLAQVRINDTNKQRASPSAGAPDDTARQRPMPGSGSSGSAGAGANQPAGR